MFLSRISSALPLNSRSSSLSHRRIVNPHCGAASGRALGPYFRGQIHHVWCGWCSHNSSLTGVMFAGIIQHSINTRAWKKYGAFIKTVNRQSLLQKNRERKKRHVGFPWPRGMRYYIAHAIWWWQRKCHTETIAGSKFIEIGQHVTWEFYLFIFFIYSLDSELPYLQLLQNTDIKCYICIKVVLRILCKSNQKIL